MEKNAGPFVARMTARLVEAVRGAWSPLGEAFHDPGVARDFVESLDPTHGPTLVRVEATGGSGEERHGVAGDWLCVGGRPGVMLPRATWDYSRDSAAWADRRELIDAWELSARPDWMLYDYATSPAPDLRVLVRAACACARTAHRPTRAAREAVEAAAAWARGEADAASAVAAEERLWAEIERRRDHPTRGRPPSYAEAAAHAAAHLVRVAELNAGTASRAGHDAARGAMFAVRSLPRRGAWERVAEALRGEVGSLPYLASHAH